MLVPAGLVDLEQPTSAIVAYLCVRAGETEEDGARRPARMHIEDLIATYWPRLVPGWPLPCPRYRRKLAQDLEQRGYLTSSLMDVPHPGSGRTRRALVYRTVRPEDLPDPRQLELPLDLLPRRRRPPSLEQRLIFVQPAQRNAFDPEGSERSGGIGSSRIPFDPSGSAPPGPPGFLPDPKACLPTQQAFSSGGQGTGGPPGRGPGRRGTPERGVPGAPEGVCPECWVLDKQAVPALGLSGRRPPELEGMGLTAQLLRTTCAACLTLACDLVRGRYPDFDDVIAGRSGPGQKLKSPCAALARCLWDRRHGNLWRVKPAAPAAPPAEVRRIIGGRPARLVDGKWVYEEAPQGPSGDESSPPPSPLQEMLTRMEGMSDG